MAVTTPPTIAALPAAPDPGNRATFNTLAYPWSAALNPFSVQVAAVATNVAGNATDAATSASTATTQAGNAATSASTATTKAGEALTSAGNASTSASTAAARLADMEALYDQFDDRYLGAKASDPELDNDGNTLAEGAFYINTVSGYLRAYTVANRWVQGISAVAGVSSIDAQTGAITLKTVNGQVIRGSGDITTGLTPTLVTGTTQTAVSGANYLLSNASATTVAAPIATNGATFAVTPANGLLTNIVDFGAATVKGPAAEASGAITLSAGCAMEVLYNSTIGKWIML